MQLLLRNKKYLKKTKISGSTSRTPTTVRKLGCCWDPEKRVPMYSIANRYRWILGFGLMGSCAGGCCSCCSSSPSLNSSTAVFAILEGLWRDSEALSRKCLGFSVMNLNFSHFLDFQTGKKLGFSGSERWEAQGLRVLPSVWVQGYADPNMGWNK
jgi:hypothetical protein